MLGNRLRHAWKNIFNERKHNRFYANSKFVTNVIFPQKSIIFVAGDVVRRGQTVAKPIEPSYSVARCDFCKIFSKCSHIDSRIYSSDFDLLLHHLDDEKYITEANDSFSCRKRRIRLQSDCEKYPSNQLAKNIVGITLKENYENLKFSTRKNLTSRHHQLQTSFTFVSVRSIHLTNNSVKMVFSTIYDNEECTFLQVKKE